MKQQPGKVKVTGLKSGKPGVHKVKEGKYGLSSNLIGKMGGEDTIEELKKAFDMCDTDKNGSLDKAELKEMMNAMAQQ